VRRSAGSRRACSEAADTGHIAEHRHRSRAYAGECSLPGTEPVKAPVKAAERTNRSDLRRMVLAVINARWPNSLP